MTQLKRVGTHVVIVFLATFIGGILSAQADWTHLSTLKSAAVAGVSAALGAILATLQPATAAASTAVGQRVAAAARSVGPRRYAVTSPGRLTRVRVVVVNQCKTAKVTDADVRAWTAACAVQAHEFAHAWGLSTPSVTFATNPPTSRVDTVIVVCDDADQAGALGYHSETQDGITYGRVFAVDCETAGVSISSCLSHEVMEALADVNADRWVDAPDGREWALEVCDPVEADAYTDPNGVELSNYVLPSFFDDSGVAPFDRLGRLRDPFTLSKSGYAVVRRAGGAAQQIFGDKAIYEAREGWRAGTKATPLSRTAYRLRTRRAHTG